ncbi:hypothetical protein BsWGS_01052 [Bradybaena similaris]
MARPYSSYSEEKSPKNLVEYISGDESWYALGVRIKFTDPVVPGNLKLQVNRPVDLIMCVETKSVLKMNPESLSACCWSNIQGEDNPCRPWRDIRLHYNPIRTMMNKYGHISHVFQASLTPTADGLFRLTFYLKFERFLIWANEFQLDNIVDVQANPSIGTQFSDTKQQATCSQKTSSHTKISSTSDGVPQPSMPAYRHPQIIRTKDACIKVFFPDQSGDDFTDKATQNFSVQHSASKMSPKDPSPKDSSYRPAKENHGVPTGNKSIECFFRKPTETATSTSSLRHEESNKVPTGNKSIECFFRKPTERATSTSSLRHEESNKGALDGHENVKDSLSVNIQETPDTSEDSESSEDERICEDHRMPNWKAMVASSKKKKSRCCYYNCSKNFYNCFIYNSI